MTEQDNAVFDTDFNLDDDYKPEPLAPQGNYFGNVVGVNREGAVITWLVVLEGNDGVMSDGETPIDGQQFSFSNYLPMPSDRDEMTKNGRTSKFQSKVNMLKRFSEKMGLNMTTMAEIDEGIDSGEWIGIPVVATLEINTYMEMTSNRIKNMARRANS